MLDFIIVLCYFTLILIVALGGSKNKTVDADAYFLSSRNLRWPSIAISTIATNVQGYQFLGHDGLGLPLWFSSGQFGNQRHSRSFDCCIRLYSDVFKTQNHHRY